MTLGRSTEYYEGALEVLLLSMLIYHPPTQSALRKAFMNKVWIVSKMLFLFHDCFLNQNVKRYCRIFFSIVSKPNPKVFEASKVIACCIQDLTYMSKCLVSPRSRHKRNGSYSPRITPDNVPKLNEDWTAHHRWLITLL